MTLRIGNAGSKPDSTEGYDPPSNKEIQASDRSFFIAPPYGWRHPVTGRHGWQPDPLMLAFGQYVKRGRYLAELSQVELAKMSGVDQGGISRLERALAPAIDGELGMASCGDGDASVVRRRGSG